MKSILVLAASAAFAQNPQVSGVSFSQPNPASRDVLIEYTLEDASAVITIDVLTNGVSIGQENIHYLSGEVNKVVAPDTHIIKWDAYKSWPDHKIEEAQVQVQVNAWPLWNTPDYMVVDLIAQNTVHYYVSAEALPEGGVTNDVYRTDKLALRRISASGITWTMGSKNETGRDADYSETAHSVTLTNDYYMAVFPTTQLQWQRIAGQWHSSSKWTKDREMRLLDTMCYCYVRDVNLSSRTANPAAVYPNPPGENSWLGLLRKHSGINNFDLPSEAQWEFAARAGHYDGYYPDGSKILGTKPDANLDKLGRYGNEWNLINLPETDTTKATPIAGSFLPNSWGLYDVLGGVAELTLDIYTTTPNDPYGSVVTSGDAVKFVLKGGSWADTVSTCRPAKRNRTVTPNDLNPGVGFRVSCRGTL